MTTPRMTDERFQIQADYIDALVKDEFWDADCLQDAHEILQECKRARAVEQRLRKQLAAYKNGDYYACAKDKRHEWEMMPNGEEEICTHCSLRRSPPKPSALEQP
jgi:predicted metal-binding protein